MLAAGSSSSGDCQMMKFECCTGGHPSYSCPARRTSASFRLKPRHAAGLSSRSAAEVPLETVRQDETGLLVDDLSIEAFGDAIANAVRRTFDAGAIRQHAEQFGRERFGDQMEDLVKSPAGQGAVR